ncbi:MAG: bifunctional diaminohydroxyphosphoribosylaminopyrimidine deaminase/5-amino-6-(5-phosphoribosylamino)uracil reductase RibD [Candidatus Sericytochromatia bacterium]
MYHEIFIEKALSLAKLGSGFVAPNPLVGCVITDEMGEIISSGYHHKIGDIHAEIDALNKCKNLDLSKAVLYCNLEPCSHNSPEKINPPCVPQIIKSGIKKVVIGMKDPNPKVSGNGIKQLEESGVEVICGVLEKECENLNKIFRTNILKKKTHVLLKMAQTLDGKIATINHSSKWITDSEARTFVHELRARYDSIMVGSNTALEDNPKLDVRLFKGRNPKRVLIDSNLLIPMDYQLVTDELVKNTYIFTSEKADKEKVKKLKDIGINIIEFQSKNNYISLKEVFDKLYEFKIYSVMVEGGSKLVTQIIRENLFDEIMIFIAPKIVGEGISSIGDINVRDINKSLEFDNINYFKINNQIVFQGDRKCLQD